MTPEERAALDAYRAAMAEQKAADAAWTEAYVAELPRGMWPGDFRYMTARQSPHAQALGRAYVESGRKVHAAWIAWKRASISAGTITEEETQ